MKERFRNLGTQVLINSPQIIKAAATILLLFVVVQAFTGMVFSTDAFSVAKDAANTLTDDIKGIADAVAPLMMVVVGIAMIFTRDPRKFETEKSILMYIIIGYALVCFATSDLVVSTITGVLNLGGGAAKDAATNVGK